MGITSQNPKWRKGCGKVFDPKHLGFSCGDINPFNDKIFYCDECEKKNHPSDYDEVLLDCPYCHKLINIKKDINEAKNEERQRILQFIESERDNGNIEAFPNCKKGFSPSLCLSNLMKYLRGEK